MCWNLGKFHMCWYSWFNVVVLKRATLYWLRDLLPLEHDFILHNLKIGKFSENQTEKFSCFFSSRRIRAVGLLPSFLTRFAFRIDIAWNLFVWITGLCFRFNSNVSQLILDQYKQLYRTCIRLCFKVCILPQYCGYDSFTSFWVIIVCICP